MDNSLIKQKARKKLELAGNEPKLVIIVIALISIAINFITGESEIISLMLNILLMPVNYGAVIYFLKLARDKDVSIEDVFLEYNDFGRIVVTMLLSALFTLLWTLLLIIPGIIKSYSYSMAQYVLKDNPEISPMEALKLSEEMMKGKKMDLFLLNISFIGWMFLVIFTLGIAIIWVGPYIQLSNAYFYEEVKESYENRI